MFKVGVSYIFHNKIFFFVGIYFVFSALLNAITGITICIPCLWKSVFGVNCPGCGLTTAFIFLIKLNFLEAFEHNWLIFIILPIGIYYIKCDFLKYKYSRNQQ